MDKKYIKIAAITALSLITIYSGYRLVKYVKNKRSLNEDEDETIESPEEVGQTSTVSNNVSQVKKPAFNGARVVKLNSKDSIGQTEVAMIQKAFNNLIADAKKVDLLSLKSNASIVSPQSAVISWLVQPIKTENAIADLSKKAERVNQVAAIKPLTVNGVFGSSSVNACKIIMGASYTTYDKVKQKRIDFNKSYGLPSPY